MSFGVLRLSKYLQPIRFYFFNLINTDKSFIAVSGFKLCEEMTVILYMFAIFEVFNGVYVLSENPMCVVKW